MKKLIINLGFILGVSTMVVGCTDYLDSDYLFEERVNIENVFQSKTIPMSGWQKDTLI